MLQLSLLLALSALQVAATAPCDSLRVPILVYHNVQPAVDATRIHKAELTMRPAIFAEQMQYLKDHGIAVVSLGDLVDALQGRKKIAQPSVVLTFDDGRANQFEYAFPVLKRFGYTATFFPFTHAIGANPRYVTWDQLKAMQSAGMTIGSHTYLHARLDKVRDPSIMDREVRGSRETLRQHLNAPVRFLAYPFGAMSKASDSAVVAAGYTAARAFVGGPWNSPKLLMRLHAVPMTENMRAFERTVGPGTR